MVLAPRFYFFLLSSTIVLVPVKNKSSIMKKFNIILWLSLLAFNGLSQCGFVSNEGYFGYFNDGSGALNYENDTECSYLITSPIQGGYLGIGFDSFDTEFNYDFVRVYDGIDESAPLLGEYSGSDIPDQVQTSGQYAFVTFSSDFSNTAEGFSAYWSCSTLSTLNECDGYVHDGLAFYPNDALQTWLISPLGNPDEIIFEFDFMDMENCCDFINVYDGFDDTGLLLGSFNGTTIPTIDLIAYSGSMFLKFTTDQSVGGAGWGGSWASSGLWYIPSDYSGVNTPMVYTCDGAPDGYFLANQTCAQALFENDPYCVYSDWDTECRDGYLECLGIGDCVDDDLIDPNPICSGVFEPVCGCDNFTYINSCIASAAGVTSWTAGACATQVFGCVDASACNFNPFANFEDGSCTYPGCTFMAACNYDPQAGCNDGSCEYPEDLYGINYVDCDGECLNDADNDGICDEDEVDVFGCTDINACNFDPLADVNDGSCEYVVLYDIIGPTSPSPFTSEEYFYSSTAGSSYEWQVVNGAITAGQGTAAVTVLWGEAGEASISVIETTESGCEGDMVSENFIILATSINEIGLQSINMYPNPASSYVFIEGEALNNGNSKLALIDSKGMLVFEGSLEDGNRLDVSGIANGIYFLVLTNTQTVLNSKLIIQR